MLAFRTCTVVVSAGLRGESILCKLPAAFRYWGMVPPKIPGSDQSYVKRAAARVSLDKCMEHTRETFIRMEPAFKTGEVRMRCLLQTKYTIHCTSCSSLFRFEPLQPTTVRMPGHFCPNCGAGPSLNGEPGGVLRTMDPQLDYWELVAAEIGLDSDTTLAQVIHSLWLEDKHATTKFVEYVQSIQSEIDSAKGSEPSIGEAHSEAS